jgi:hypothetical protein
MKRHISIFAVTALIFILCGAGGVNPQTVPKTLLLLTEPELLVVFSERVPIRVQYLARDGQPIPDTLVIFIPQSDTADTTLSPRSVNTNTDGIAETYIEAGNTEVDFDVVIGVPSDDSVLPITVRVRVIQGNDEVLEARWPSEEFSSIQDAINALADGGTLKIAAGIYEIEEPIFIEGRNLVIEGVGSGQKRKKHKHKRPNYKNLKQIIPEDTEPKYKKRFTHLIGRIPQPVKDADGNVTLHADAVQGMFEISDSVVLLKGMRTSGFDAGVVVRADSGGNASSVKIKDIVIDNAGRGIFGTAPGDLAIENVTIENTLWHGISVAPPFSLEGIENYIEINNCFILDPEGAGIYITNVSASIVNEFIDNAKMGGILIYRGKASIYQCDLYNNKLAGIIYYESNLFNPPYAPINLIQDNNIIFTKPIKIGDEDRWGDGIHMIASDGSVRENWVLYPARSGLVNFASEIYIGNNMIYCPLFHIQVESWKGVNGSFVDLGENYCGCSDDPFIPCGASSSNLGPPAPPFP